MTIAGRRLTPYFLLGPGILWLVVFFVLPMYFMGKLSLYSGTLESGFTFDWNFSNYGDSLTLYGSQFGRSLYYAGAATVLAIGAFIVVMVKRENRGRRA